VRLELGDVRGFVFDIDGSLVHRGADFRAEPLPGAVEVLESIRASGRPLVLFTNGSHMSPAAFAEGLRTAGLPVGDDEVLTPVCSAITYLKRRHPGGPAMVFGSPAVRERMAGEGIPLVEGDEAAAEVDMDAMEAAARAVLRGARLLTANYLQGYWGADGIIFSRGAMITAGIAKVTGTRPIVVGKPSRPAVEELSAHLGVPSEELAVIGDDIGMDIALGHIGGSKTILVRSGISGTIDLDSVPERKRPHAVVDGVDEILDWL
jgi:ribonucleotide monophosphatase NagD (HAD superfamily)